MKTESKITNGNKAQTTLAQINAQIEALKQERVGLAQPMKVRYTELRDELLEVEIQIRELDPSWKPARLKPSADDKIKEVIQGKGKPMNEAEILSAVGGLFTPSKVKKVLKKRSTGARAIFALDSAGNYSLKV